MKAWRYGREIVTDLCQKAVDQYSLTGCLLNLQALRGAIKSRKTEIFCDIEENCFRSLLCTSNLYLFLVLHLPKYIRISLCPTAWILYPLFQRGYFETNITAWEVFIFITSIREVRLKIGIKLHFPKTVFIFDIIDFNFTDYFVRLIQILYRFLV